MEFVQHVADNSSLSLSGVTGCLSATEVPAAGTALGVTESHLAGEVGKASALGSRAQAPFLKGGGTSVVFVLCLGLLMNIHVIAGPAFVTLQWLGDI